MYLKTSLRGPVVSMTKEMPSCAGPGCAVQRRKVLSAPDLMLPEYLSNVFLWRRALFTDTKITQHFLLAAKQGCDAQKQHLPVLREFA